MSRKIKYYLLKPDEPKWFSFEIYHVYTNNEYLAKQYMLNYNIKESDVLNTTSFIIREFEAESEQEFFNMVLEECNISINEGDKLCRYVSRNGITFIESFNVMSEYDLGDLYEGILQNLIVSWLNVRNIQNYMEKEYQECINLFMKVMYKMIARFLCLQNIDIYNPTLRMVEELGFRDDSLTEVSDIIDEELIYYVYLHGEECLDELD